MAARATALAVRGGLYRTGLLNNVQESGPTAPPSVATWQFTGLASSRYRVSATGALTPIAPPMPLQHQRRRPDPGQSATEPERLRRRRRGLGDLASSDLAAAPDGAAIQYRRQRQRHRRCHPHRTHRRCEHALSPTLAGLTPAQAVAGAAVTLTGTNFGAQQGTGSVQFGVSRPRWTPGAHADRRTRPGRTGRPSRYAWPPRRAPATASPSPMSPPARSATMAQRATAPPACGDPLPDRLPQQRQESSRQCTERGDLAVHRLPLASTASRPPGARTQSRHQCALQHQRRRADPGRPATEPE